MQIQYGNSYSPLEDRREGLKGILNTCWNRFELRRKLLSGVMVGVLPFEGLSGYFVAAIR